MRIENILKMYNINTNVLEKTLKMLVFNSILFLT